MEKNISKNPYSVAFGRQPYQFIKRTLQQNSIVELFTREPVTQQIAMITGVRGSGKTVLMTMVSGQIAKDKNWIVIELNPKRDMLESLASKLSSEHKIAQLFKSARLNLSFWGFGMEVEAAVPITDIETALIKMLEVLQKHNKKVLITVDEATNSKEMKIFAHSFQILIRRELPVFLLMTGLYENIHTLQNEKSLTFLYRTPRIDMDPLNINRIADNYRQIFDMDSSTAMKMAVMTRGYPFAFQALGYLVWEAGEFRAEIEKEYRYYLEEYVYEKIWSELSANDRKTVYGIARSGSGKTKEIQDILQISHDQFSPYRKRLIQKGIIEGNAHGRVQFVLPLFDQFVLQKADD